MTPEQCRAARELLNWSQDDLAKASRVPVEIVAMFEDGKLAGMMDCQAAMREALKPVWHWLSVADRRGEQ
jgi:ribosome-binding protein aMBF1 (putative translation factor)